jgi:hypothetical protein
MQTCVKKEFLYHTYVATTYYYLYVIISVTQANSPVECTRKIPAVELSQKKWGFHDPIKKWNSTFQLFNFYSTFSTSTTFLRAYHSLTKGQYLPSGKGVKVE